jgi:hypothetical protein
MNTKISGEREITVNYYKSTVTEFLLASHRMLLVRLIATRISCRLINLMNAAFVLLVDHLSSTRMVASASIAFFVAYFLLFEEREVVSSISILEETIAKRSGDEEEDFYIKSLYRPAKYKLPNIEPLFWLVLIIGLIVLRLVSG